MEETPKALRVAVVEDDPRIQQLISAEITDEGHACICFGSAEDFLDEAGSDRFDLLLLDLMLPGMDGLACLKQLQLQAASQPALRVVIVTALNDADKKHEALANGAEAYVLKPDLFEQLPPSRARSADTGTRNGWREGIKRTRAEAGAPGGRLATPEAQSCRDRAPVRQASSKRLRSMGTAAPPPRSSLRSWDVITRWRTRPSSD